MTSAYLNALHEEGTREALARELGRLYDENKRLQKELRAERQDNGAVIAGLQGEIERLRELKAPASRALLNITMQALESAEAENDRLRDLLEWNGIDPDVMPDGLVRRRAQSRKHKDQLPPIDWRGGRTESGSDM